MLKFRAFTLLVLLYFPFVFLNAARQDSIGKKKVDGKWYIVHQVNQGEGLFSVSRKYGIPLAKLKESNPHIGNFLKIGQLLMVPTKTNQITEEHSQVKDEILDNTYIVKSGETLFSIGQKTKVSINDLIEINHLKSTEISIGQVLKLNKGPRKIETFDTLKKNPAVIHHADDYRKDSFHIKEFGIMKIEEVGFGETSKLGEINPLRNEAFHYEAPIGTILLVKNISNNRSVFVKVVGNSPFDGNQNSILFLSEKATSILGIQSKTKVKISYAK